MESGGSHIATRAYEVYRLIHKIRWAIYRIGMNPEDLGRMIEHNRTQTILQKTRRNYLGGSAEIMEKVSQRVFIQNDPSYTTMCKFFKLASGCETFSMLSPIKSDSKHLTIDMEALIGDPTNNVADQESVLLLHQYGFSDLYGVSGKYLKNLIEEPVRQIVENEDYRKSVPQLKYAEPDPTEVPHDQGDPGSGSRPSEAAHDYASAPTSAPKVFGPGGVQYDPPKPDGPMEKPNVDLRPRSGSVGASAKPKARPAAPKSQPQSPAPKPMPSSGLLLDDRLHHLYQPGDKMRVELKARTQLILVPQMSLHNLHKLQLILSQPIK